MKEALSDTRISSIHFCVHESLAKGQKPTVESSRAQIIQGQDLLGSYARCDDCAVGRSR